MNKNSKKTSAPGLGSGLTTQSAGNSIQPTPQFASGVSQDNSSAAANSTGNPATKNSNLSVTLGQSKNGTQDANMTGDDAKKGAAGKDGAANQANLKLKDPNQAHETLEIAKNVP
jgi:hypothetical protein